MEDIRQWKVRQALERIESDYYDDPQILEVVVDRLINGLDTHRASEPGSAPIPLA